MPNRRGLILLTGAIVMCAAAPSFSQPVKVSVATDGTPANQSSFWPAPSADGRFVAFVSRATNLVPGDTNGIEDVFLRDRDTDADGVFDEAGAVSTVRVSERNGIQGNGENQRLAITPDGRYVVFESKASTLFATNQPPLANYQIVRWDRVTGAFVLVSQNAAGEPLNGRNAEPAVTADGNTVYFVSYATNDGTGPATDRGLVLRRDIADATLMRVSDPIDPSNPVQAGSPTVSDDGSIFAYALTSFSGGVFPAGGTSYVHAAGQPVRTYPGTSPKLSADGQVLGLLAAQARQVHLPSGQTVSAGIVVTPIAPAAMSRSGRYLVWGTSGIADFTYGSVVPAPWDDAPIGGHAAFVGDTHLAYTVGELNAMPFISDLFVEPIASLVDLDADGLNDHWEAAFGSSFAPGSGATGVDGPDGDPDTDGLSNAQEQAIGSNPRGTQARYLAEGTSGTFFTTRYAIANPGIGAVAAAVRFETGDGRLVKRVVSVPERSRVTIDSRTFGLGPTSFAAVVESAAPLVVDRLMTWGDPNLPYGSHGETAAAAPGTSWLLAEGTTVLGFQLFYLLQNPQATTVTATIRYLLPFGAPVVRTYDLPPHSRTTVFVNTVPGLDSTDVSAAITATQPIAVERAMYRSGPGQIFALGHAAAAVPQPSATWFFGEGSTGAFFDTYLMFANPSAQPASVQVRYFRDFDDPVERTYTVPANSRVSVFVDGEPGLAATSFGTRITSSVPIVAERAMYWAGGYFDYYEGHVTAGAIQTASRWVLAESEERGPYGARTYVLIVNTGDAPALVAVRSLPEAPDAPGAVGPILIAGNSRRTVPLSLLPGFGRGGVEVVEQGSATGALIVEGAIYWDVGGVPFAAGANWLATPMP